MLNRQEEDPNNGLMFSKIYLIKLANGVRNATHKQSSEPNPGLR